MNDGQVSDGHGDLVPADQVEFYQAILHKTRWIAANSISGQLANAVDVKVFLDQWEEVWQVTIMGDLLFESLEAISYPADWWQAVKERWLPRWLLARYPVRYRRYEINAYHPNIVLPNDKAIVRVPKFPHFTTDREAKSERG